MKNKILALACLCTSLNVSAQYTKLLDFSGAENGANPHGSLISDGTFLYGMTYNGGISGIGTIFKIMPDGTGYSKLMDFTGTANGSNPNGSLISDGTFLYGTTQNGGTHGDGTVFKIMPDGTGFSTLVNFEDSAKGEFPFGSLISDGTFLYGMTEQGGAHDDGTMFKVMPDGTGYVKLLDFEQAATGQFPYGSFISDGTFFYAMTSEGGANNDGTIFKILPDGTGYFRLLNFEEDFSGEFPHGDLLYDGTFLYGMAKDGGSSDAGTVFKIMPDGTGYTKLLNFTGVVNGKNPYGSLISDGIFLYGLTREGGSSNDGTLFKIMPDGTGYSKLLDFGGTYGNNLRGSLISDGTYLYGMTRDGGANDLGTIFKFQLASTNIHETHLQTMINVFPNPSDGKFIIKNDLPGDMNYELDIYNLMGEKIYHHQSGSMANNEIDLQEFPKGIYYAKISNGINTCTQKIIFH